ncbi:uncharacterized protein B0J16DRAFT_336030 [Fusarium flagelliforme]|uniref:Subtilisin-like serine protease n=1 Tax=Fusarium flagelliforme TaxID=2675880 RepID=A0A395MGB7_9HYPO|nr:uncharacterized protein B0J16DRAFT_336030 [Fusarium flagelliforme]KAH7193807.1 hypothetical protein B0J16DRAFT_336030 [Fusarium flagelliforme]RFN46169.1 subtilisin-like serine protease [Fusarium flagelliforme]
MTTLTREDLTEPPFAEAFQLFKLTESAASQTATPQRLPGYPRISLQDQPKLHNFLEKEYCSNDLDVVAKRLWWMSTQDHANISPLHRQAVKGRNIVVTQDPKLHLVWIQDRIFIKPLPKYLTSHAFWKHYLGADGGPRRERIRKAALGFLRTYFYLIQSEYDFNLAQDISRCLIPAGVTWEKFCDFSSDFPEISDKSVSLRYAYGEIRLTRLNLYAPLILGKSKFQRVEYQYGAYFAHFYGPILFMVAMVSTILSGLQVAIAVQQEHPGRNSLGIQDAGLWFSVVIILFLCAVILLLFSVLIYKIAREWRFAIRDRVRILKEGKGEVTVAE